MVLVEEVVAIKQKVFYFPDISLCLESKLYKSVLHQVILAIKEESGFSGLVEIFLDPLQVKNLRIIHGE